MMSGVGNEYENICKLLDGKLDMVVGLSKSQADAVPALSNCEDYDLTPLDLTKKTKSTAAIDETIQSPSSSEKPSQLPNDESNQVDEEDYQELRKFICSCGKLVENERQFEQHRKVCWVKPNPQNARYYTFDEMSAIVTMHCYQKKQILERLTERGEIVKGRIYTCQTCRQSFKHEILLTHHIGLHKLAHETEESI